MKKKLKAEKSYLKDSIGKNSYKISRREKVTVDYSTRTDRQLVDLAIMGDVDARNYLVSKHLNLIWKIVRKYKLPDERDNWDLFQECTIEFCRAIDKFKFIYKNIKVTSYAAYWMHAKIKKFISDNGRIKNHTDDEDIEEHPIVHSLSSEPQLLEVINILSEKELELFNNLYVFKLSLTDIAAQRSEEEGREVKLLTIFMEKKRMLKKVKEALASDNGEPNKKIRRKKNNNIK